VSTVRLTTAQALVRFLAVQHSERDGQRRRLIAGCFGIFGHGNLAGVGQALHQYAELLPFHPAKNEQAMVHVAAAYARQTNRLSTFACTSSVGPGATNMVTGAALATVNRLPVLLLPGDVFATRTPHPVLQQVEHPTDASVSANDTLRPVSRFFERVERPEQLLGCLPEAMRVLTDPAQTGAVTLALPEDVQTEAFDFPAALFEPRVWTVYRQPPAPEALLRAEAMIRAAARPLIVAGGGTIYSAATGALLDLVNTVGVPVAETPAGRGALLSDHPLSLGAVGATGNPAANRLARDADLVIGVGTRWTDFTTGSKTAFQNPGVRFINVNVDGSDAAKLSGLPLLGDARLVLEALRARLGDHRVAAAWVARASSESAAWGQEVRRVVSAAADGAGLPTQAAVIGAINDLAGERGVVINAAGSAPGDLHKLWRARDPDGKGYHVEYGYSCMGYEIPAGIGVKLAAPEREVFVLIGDGSYLMLSGELVTAVAERIALRVIIVDNHGYASIGSLSRSVGSRGFGTHHRRSLTGVAPTDNADGSGLADPSASEQLDLDLAANAASLGAQAHRVTTTGELCEVLQAARDVPLPVVVVIETDRYLGLPAYEGWWQVPVAEVATQPEVQRARTRYESELRAQRLHLEVIGDE
jgi:3D-(3,5/4)-trihydroxycyclohexane-1,2-dione acylhydrolase (decyclizing)